jgi:hypothetical protein
VAVRVTQVPCANSALQVAPQEMPPGEELTVPLPVFDTVSCSGSPPEKVAVQSRLADPTVTVIVALPLVPQPPVHPWNVRPSPGTAVSATTDPGVKRPVHAGPQSIPVGLLATRPGPPTCVTWMVFHSPAGGAGGLVVAISRPAA